MTLEDWLKLLHILGAIVWIGGGLTLSVLALRVRSGGGGAAIAEFGQMLAWIGPRLLAPAVVATIVFGIWLVLASGAWDFGQLWVLIGIGLFLVAFVVGAIYLSRIGIQLGRLDGSARPEEARGLLNRWLTGYGAVLLILVVAVWDMVFKPGL